MSEDNEADVCCAACGIKEVDDIKLKNCNACYLVKYCSVECQKNLTGSSIKKSARSGWLNCEKNYCSSNPKVATWGTALSASYAVT